MRLDLMRRIERLEKRDGESVVVFIGVGIDPESDEVKPMSGWEVVSVTKP